MKKIFLTLVLMLSAAMAFAAEKSVAVFTLDHQMSQTCERKIKTNLRYEKGVSSIDVSLKENTIKIVYSPEKSNPEQLIKAFKKIGFNAFELKPAVKTVPDKVSTDKKVEAKQKKKE